MILGSSVLRFVTRYYSFGPVVERLLHEGKLQVDKSQEYAIKYLNNLARDLESRHKQSSSRSIWTNFSSNKTTALKGAYIYGSVGSGKTMLMDLFYNNVKISGKSRFHFNQFMLQFHSGLRKFRNEGSQDPVKELVEEYCRGMKLLCLDEFQVTDIADAMILRKLLSSFIESGMTIVTTSNRHPDDLYLNGIQRNSFIPCIELIKSSLELINLSSETDYRTRKVHCQVEGNCFLSPINAETDRAIQDEFKTACQDASYLELNVFGRVLKVSEGKFGTCAKFTFQELFEESKSAADYIEIAKAFPKIFITEIPEFTIEMRNEIRRFITFIDQIYENKNGLIVQSERDLILNLEKLKEELPSTYDESFALNRTISRLKEIKAT